MSLDYADELLKGISSDLQYTNTNLKVSTVEVNKQGGQISNIQGNIEQTDASVKTTDKSMFRIEARAKIYRIGLYAVIVLEFITILCLILRKIF